MIRDTTIYLHRPTKTQNDIGEWISSVDRVEIFAKVNEVSSSEFFAASQIGLAPEKRFLVFAGDYEGETVVEYNGDIYSVYRTYQTTPDVTEIYAQREAGTAGTTTEITTESTSTTESTDGD